MPIRPITETFAHDIDNVISERANDERGVFDPTASPFPGSFVENVGGDNPVTRVAALLHVGYRESEASETPAPNDIPVKELLAFARTHRGDDNIEHRYRERIGSTLSAVRAFCVVTCQSSAVRAVADCSCVSCPLWPFRMGTNGMRGKR